MRSFNPLLSKDIFQCVFTYLDAAKDCRDINLVCQFWHVWIKELKKANAINALIHKFYLPANIVLLLDSPNLVHTRLVKIYNRSKADVSDAKLFEVFCAGGTINQDFLCMLDSKIPWFETYYADASLYFLEMHFRYACMIGNVELVDYLINKKQCAPEFIHLKMAAGSGSLRLAKYFLDKNADSFQMKPDNIEELYRHAIMSGNVLLLQYLIDKCERPPKLDDMLYLAVSSGAAEMVKFIFYSCGFDFDEVIHYAALRQSRSVEVIQCLIEDCCWFSPLLLALNAKDVHRVAKKMRYMAYNTGVISIIEYVEKKFPINQINSYRILESAVSSGNLEIVNRCIKQYDISLSQFINTEMAYKLFKAAVTSGNIDTAKFLITRLGDLRNTESYKNSELIEACFKSKKNKVSMMQYLEQTLDCRMTELPWMDIVYNTNLELASYIYPYILKIETRDDFRYKHLIYKPESLMNIYHLINHDGYQFSDKLLEWVLRYIERDDEGLNSRILFAKYLIENHHLVPTKYVIDHIDHTSDERLQALLPQKGMRLC